MKLDAVAERLGTLAAAAAGWPEGSTPELVINDIVRRWARRQGGVLERTGGLELEPSQVGFLQTFDLDYGRRRLRFVVQGINDLYADLGQSNHPDRRDLDKAKDELYQLEEELDVDRLLKTDQGVALADGAARLFDQMALEVAGLWGPPPDEGTGDAPIDRVEAFVTDHADDLDALYAATTAFLNEELDDFSERVSTAFTNITEGWDADARKKIDVRFTGFPIWDVLVFPLRRFSNMGELSPINVVRFSPEDSKKITEKGSEKLAGAGLAHFGAFFDRPGREADYLWGRLDAAERLLGLLGEEDESLYEEAFAAILADERTALSAETIATIEEEMKNRE
jgi:hypothetical protein